VASSHTLLPESLEWALAHLIKYGDTDLLPVPFEYEAIKADWKTVKPRLEKYDLAEPRPGATTRFLVPKPEGAFRVITRLDPIDALIYTAAVYECADAIEKSRAAPNIACSYRIETAADGRFFAAGNTWDVFTQRSIELVNEPSCKYVVTADISDFYSQISQHRIRNALEDAGISNDRAQAIERLLSSWTALQSRGIPVGPHASIILAEACINDVDQHLASRNYAHVRYVDDFRIFCRTHGDAVRAIHDLCEYLFTSHRLALHPNKTRTYKKATFLKEVVQKPETIEIDKQKDKIQEMMEAWASAGYPLTDEEIDKQEIDLDVLVELFDECLAKKPLKVGLLKHLLRRAAALRTNRVQQTALENLPNLISAFRDVVIYLQRSKQKKSSKKVADHLLKFGTESDYSFLPYTQEWVVAALTTTFATTCSAEDLSRLAKHIRTGMGIRGEAMIALARKDTAWVRAHKESVKALAPWDRRAVIFAGASLKDDERSAWKKSVLATDDILDRAVAILALQ
jgi:hypothetical protein